MKTQESETHYILFETSKGLPFRLVETQNPDYQQAINLHANQIGGLVNCREISSTEAIHYRQKLNALEKNPIVQDMRNRARAFYLASLESSEIGVN